MIYSWTKLRDVRRFLNTRGSYIRLLGRIVVVNVAWMSLGSTGFAFERDEHRELSDAAFFLAMAEVFDDYAATRADQSKRGEDGDALLARACLFVSDAYRAHLSVCVLPRVDAMVRASLEAVAKSSKRRLTYGEISACVDNVVDPGALLAIDPTVGAPWRSARVVERDSDSITSICRSGWYESVSATHNASHFGDAAVREFRTRHRFAVSAIGELSAVDAMEEQRKAESAWIDVAIGSSAVADHYLLDLFAPGHMVVQRFGVPDAIARFFHNKVNREGLAYHPFTPEEIRTGAIAACDRINRSTISGSWIEALRNECGKRPRTAILSSFSGGRRFFGDGVFLEAIDTAVGDARQGRNAGIGIGEVGNQMLLMVVTAARSSTEVLSRLKEALEARERGVPNIGAKSDSISVFDRKAFSAHCVSAVPNGPCLAVEMRESVSEDALDVVQRAYPAEPLPRLFGTVSRVSLLQLTAVSLTRFGDSLVEFPAAFSVDYIPLVVQLRRTFVLGAVGYVFDWEGHGDHSRSLFGNGNGWQGRVWVGVDLLKSGIGLYYQRLKYEPRREVLVPARRESWGVRFDYGLTDMVSAVVMVGRDRVWADLSVDATSVSVGFSLMFPTNELF